MQVKKQYEMIVAAYKAQRLQLEVSVQEAAAYKKENHALRVRALPTQPSSLATTTRAFDP